MKDLKKLFIELKGSCSKSILKPRYIEFEIEDISELSYKKLKALLREELKHLNLEMIASLEYKLEDNKLHLKLVQ